jgi:uroporphyrinogen decarboxylase
MEKRKKMMMTDRERIEALLKRQKPDRVPIWPFAYDGFAVVYAKASISDAYNNPEVSLAAQQKACKDFGWVFSPFFSYASFGAWEFGGKIKWPSGEFSQAPTIVRYPVETEDDARNLEMPDVKTAGFLPLKMDFAKRSAQERLDNEPFNVEAFGGGGFGLAANIAGVETFLRWIIKKPDVAHHLMRLAVDFKIALAQYWKDTFGTEGVIPKGAEPTASNQMISPKQFERFAFPYIKETQEKILAMGYRNTYMHICGEQNLNLPHWAKIPFGDPGIVSIGHEITIEVAGKYFPDQIILGSVDPIIIQTGAPEDVYNATRKNIEEGKKLPGGYIFSPGCQLPPRANPENVMAMTRAANDVGWYA